MQLTGRNVSITTLLVFLIAFSFVVLPLVSAQYYTAPCTVTTAVNYQGAGIITPGTSTYTYGSYVIFTEYTNPGYSFNGWYLDGVYEGKLSSIPIIMYQSYQLIAVYSVSLAWLTISSGSQGSTNPGPGLWNYTYGSVTTVSESPNAGSTFSGWYLDGTFMGTTSSLTLTMTQDHQLDAFFSGGNNLAPTPTPSSMIAPTPNPNLLSPSLQFYCTSSASNSAYNIEIQGNLAYNGSGLVDAGIYLSYSVTNGATWQDFAYVTTGYWGNFSATWMPSSSGDYIIRAIYFGDNVYSAITGTVSFSLTPLQFQNQDVFSVTSNSTVSGLTFNSATDSLSFGVTGPSGTTGYAQICIAKSLLPVITNLQVNLDNSVISYSAFSNGNIWMITFYYHHSSHNIVMALNSASSLPTSTSTSTSTSATAPPTTNPTNSLVASPTSTLTAATPEFPLVFLPLILVMASLAIGVLLKKRAKTAN